MENEYLGDGVYVEIVQGDLKLTTGPRHSNPDSTIYLEPKVFDALVQYANRSTDKLAKVEKSLAELKSEGIIVDYTVERDGDDIKVSIMPFVPVKDIEVKIEI